jgi:hypothetical protein
MKRSKRQDNGIEGIEEKNYRAKRLHLMGVILQPKTKRNPLFVIEKLPVKESYT